MKKPIFEKFQAKNLSKESQRSIVGGTTVYECIGYCMTAAFDFFNTFCEGAWDSGYYYGTCRFQCEGDPSSTSWDFDCP